MGQNPAFLFYPGDWLGGTIGMTLEEKGAYIELLVAQFNRGHMTEDMICRMIGQHWGQIKDKFRLDSNGLYYNERLEQEQEKRKKYSESRSNNKKGANQYSKKEPENGGHMTSHMENENRNTVLSSLGNMPTMGKEEFEKFKIRLLADSVFTESLMISRGIKNGKDLEGWILTFHTHIAGEGKIQKDYAEYRRHFKNWIATQDTFKTPPIGKPEKRMVI